MKFSYVKLPSKDPQRKWVKRPLIPVRLSGPKNTWEGYALIDSGADRSLFNLEIAKFIGIDLLHSKNELFAGISKFPVLTYISEVTVEVVGIDQKIHITAGFMDNANLPVILGQEGFFDNFKIKFDRSRDSIELSPS